MGTKSRVMIRNFGWIASWKITHRCNLRCSYCNPRELLPLSAPETGDPEMVIRKIAEFRPKYLNITGGEPTAVSVLPSVLRYARETWNPSTYVVHNGSTIQKLDNVFPFIDRFVISLDGPGEWNRKTKGIDGDRVLDGLREIVPDATAAGVDISINCVLTTSMLPHMRELAQRVHRKTPEAVLCFSPLLPPLSTESILAAPDLLDSFWREYRTLKKEGYNIVQTFDHLLIHDNYHKVQCYNQFFTLRVNPEGKVASCAMNVPVQTGEYARKWKKLLTVDGAMRAKDMAWKLLNNKLLGTIDFSCTTVCHCETWLDMLFMNRTGDATPIYLKGLVGRVTENELLEMEMFVKQHINPLFDLDFFKGEMMRSGRYRSVGESVT